jgi:jumonji domain-containing protein 7
LAAEVPPFIEIAKEAFGNQPDAVNIWIGDERAVSSMHKDHYENMYCVVKGRKHFTLLPPAAIACLYETTYDSARYQHQTTSAYVSSDEPCTHAFHTKFPAFSSWNIVMEPSKDKTPWVPVDPFAIDISKYPLARHLKPIECIIEEGEILYLPAMWYHRATQLCETLSINYWHDMDFDCRYVYYNFVTQIANRIKK